MTDENTYTQNEVNQLIIIARDRTETLQALDCARSIMIETKQYPKFINRINYIIQSVIGIKEEEEVKEEKEEVKQIPKEKEVKQNPKEKKLKPLP